MRIIFLFLLLVATNLFAQNDTKYYGIKLGETPQVNKQHLYFQFSPERQMVTFFWIDYEIDKLNPREIKMEDSGFSLKLANDSVLVFKADPKYSSSMETDRGEILTMLSPITKDEIKMINSNPAKSIQLFFNKYQIFDVDPLTTNNREELKNQTSSILKMLN